MANTLGEIIESLKETPKVEKWEYTYCKSASLNIREIILRLNEEGKDGWELVQIIKDQFGFMAIFKRKIQQG